MRVLFVTSEAQPFAKTGGLADVSAALPAALASRGIDMRILLPGYKQALDQAPDAKEILWLGNPLGYGETRLLQTQMPGSGIPVWLVDCPDLYNRKGNLYTDPSGRDWADNDLRFALLSHVAAGIAREGGGSWRPDIVHANDWHAGLVPLLMAPRGAARAPSVFTIHNLAYQGLFDFDRFDELGLQPDACGHLEFYGRLSFLKAGIAVADAVTTVSPNYAREILTPEHGCGLDGLLRERSANLTGILNGVDYQQWDPAIDPCLVHNYSHRSLAGKRACKYALQEELGLERLADAPLIAFMSRLTHQKMPDTVLEALPALLADGIQFALVGEGEDRYEASFRQFAEAYPRQVGIKRGYDECSAHRLLAGADLLLHPSRFEPCGLVPIYAMRYGTVPVVRRSGGMADTVVEHGNPDAQAGTETGFAFDQPTVSDMTACVYSAISLFRQPVAWRRMMISGMRKDFGWHRSADAYIRIYSSLAKVSDAPLAAEEQERRSA